MIQSHSKQLKGTSLVLTNIGYCLGTRNALLLLVLVDTKKLRTGKYVLQVLQHVSNFARIHRKQFNLAMILFIEL